ncbi:MAG: YkgJ family cysteine cluster protein [Candidatus Korarchaeum sp.]
MRCLDGCYACCLETEMVLTESDLRRIESLGYKREQFSEVRDGFIRLRNVEGRCYFLDGGSCRIYEARPLGCRAYPLVFNITNGRCELDDECPVIDTIDDEEFQNKCKIITEIVEELLNR